jgi:hypothetical protein
MWGPSTDTGETHAFTDLADTLDSYSGSKVAFYHWMFGLQTTE